MDKENQIGGTRLEDLLALIPDAAIVCNQAGKIVQTNLLAEKLFGYSKQSLQQQAIEILIPARFVAKHPQLIKNHFANAHARPMGTSSTL
jgi:PAS domain S-box-containing protein